MPAGSRRDHFVHLPLIEQTARDNANLKLGHCGVFILTLLPNSYPLIPYQLQRLGTKVVCIFFRSILLEQINWKNCQGLLAVCPHLHHSFHASLPILHFKSQTPGQWHYLNFRVRKYLLPCEGSSFLKQCCFRAHCCLTPPPPAHYCPRNHCIIATMPPGAWKTHLVH